MQVVKRSGRTEKFVMSKIETRIRKLCDGLDKKFIDPTQVAQRVVGGAFDGITSNELDAMSAETAASMSGDHPDYAVLAGRIVASVIQKEAPATFTEAMKDLYNHTNNGKPDPLVSDEIYELVNKQGEKYDSLIKHEQDFTYDYFAIKTLERAYLQKVEGRIVETPQYLLMRVAIGIHGGDYENVKSTYTLLNEKYFTHATPTLFNAGTQKPQMISCLTGEVAEDSMTGIYKTLHDVAMLSKHGAGIGVSVDKVRSKGTKIGGGGTSDGIIPMLRVFNATARYSNQLGKRKGSFAIYVNPAHPDTMDFLELKKNTGDEEQRTRDLFLSMWCPDVFFERVIEGGTWSFFDPNECKELNDLYGAEYTAEYNQLEANGKAVRSIPARELWAKIIESQIETGVPYVAARDHFNAHNMQSNMGPIKTSNLCHEIALHTAPDEWGNCVLSSIAVNKFYTNGVYDFEKLGEVTQQITINLNRCIDRNFYAIPEAEKGALMQRALGIGIQGLADLYANMKISFDDEEAQVINRQIMETIYYHAITASHKLAMIEGSYPRFEGSPWQKGNLHIDNWDTELMYDWEPIRKMAQKGMKNSLLTALMPTASTSQILGNNECFEPFTSNIYVRRTLSGDFVVVNKHLINELCELGMWNDYMSNRIVGESGSIQKIHEIPEDVRRRYRTIWEYSQRPLIDLAAGRAPFVDQSQSMNLWFKEPNFNSISNALMHGWRQGLKTLSYYVRTQAPVSSAKFTVKEEMKPTAEAVACSLDAPEECEACSG